MSEKEGLLIEDVPVMSSGQLTADTKKVLMGIIEREFTNKDSLFHQIQQRERTKILEKYRKEVNFDGLMKQIKNMRERITRAERDLEDTITELTKVGLTEGGSIAPLSYPVRDELHGGRIYRTNTAATRLQKLLSTIEKNAPSQNLKSKLITRLHLSVSMGEAQVIMRQVLGNGIIPAVDDVKKIELVEG